MMRVFVEGGSIVIPQSIIINGKMDGNKIKKDSYLVLMAEIHKFLKLPGRAVPGGRSEKACVLITPGFIGGMLRKRHQLYVVVAVFFQPWNQQLCQLLIAVPVL